MKKTFFLSSWGAKLAFAAVVLTSPLLTSCEQEELDATFQAAPAKVTLAEYEDEVCVVSDRAASIPIHVSSV